MRNAWVATQPMTTATANRPPSRTSTAPQSGSAESAARLATTVQSTGLYAATRWIQDGIGFVVHTALLVPYFSWQRSHAVHHARTNHLTQGETHVPRTVAPGRGGLSVLARDADVHANLPCDWLTI